MKRCKFLLFWIILFLGLLPLYASYPYRFQYNESEAQSNNNTTTYQDKVTLTVDPGEIPANYLIIASAELKGANTGVDTRAQLDIGGAVYGQTTWEPRVTNNWESFITHKVVNLSVSTDVKIQWATETAGRNSSIRRARIWAIRLGDASTYSMAEDETPTTLPASYNDDCVLTFTPASTGDYLLLGTGEYQPASTGRSAFARWLVDGTFYDSSLYEGKDVNDYKTFAFCKIVNLDASSHTIKIQCRRETSSGGERRNLRIIAIRLSDYYTYEATAESESEQSTTTTNFSAVAVTKTFTPVSAEDYLVIGSAQIRENNTSYAVQAKLQVDGTDYAIMWDRPKDATDYYSFATLKQLSLTAASHTIRIVYATNNSSSRAYIKSAHIQIIRQPPINLSVSTPITSWPLGIIDAGAVQTSNSGNKIGITNNGNVTETFTLQVLDEDDRNEWTASTSESGAGTNVYVFSGIFCATTDAPVADDFNEGTSDDVVTTTSQVADATKYAYTGGANNGTGISVEAARSLWFRVDMPTAVSGTYYDQEHTVIIRIGCQQ